MNWIYITIALWSVFGIYFFNTCKFENWPIWRLLGVGFLCGPVAWITMTIGFFRGFSEGLVKRNERRPPRDRLRTDYSGRWHCGCPHHLCPEIHMKPTPSISALDLAKLARDSFNEAWPNKVNMEDKINFCLSESAKSLRAKLAESGIEIEP